MYSGTRAGAALRRTASAGECLGRSMYPKQIGLTALRAAAVTTEARVRQLSRLAAVP
jgi:hypothetical protein